MDGRTKDKVLLFQSLINKIDTDRDGKTHREADHKLFKRGEILYETVIKEVVTSDAI